MSGNSILLDTNVIIEVFSGNIALADKINRQAKLYVSAISVGELYTGIYRVLNKEKHLNLLNNFLKLCSILEVTDKTAEHYGFILAQLYKKGKPIPTNDIWIAATAKEHNLDLITFDKHFNEIENLSVNDPQSF